MSVERHVPPRESQLFVWLSSAVPTTRQSEKDCEQACGRHLKFLFPHLVMDKTGGAIS